MDSKTLYFFHYSFMPTVDIQEILIFLACWRKTSNPMLCTPTLSLFGFIFNLCISERGLDWAVYKTDCSLLNKKQISHKRFSPKLPCQLLRLSNHNSAPNHTLFQKELQLPRSSQPLPHLGTDICHFSVLLPLCKGFVNPRNTICPLT